jgi:hypothetical protein
MLTKTPAKSGRQHSGDGAEQSAPTLDLFHSCALWAWMEIYWETGQWPPDSELTRQRAYELYEAEIANKKEA